MELFRILTVQASCVFSCKEQAKKYILSPLSWIDSSFLWTEEFDLHFGSKIKIPKTCQNPFYKQFGAVLCKKTAPKNTKYLINETILKIGHHAKACKFLTLGQKLKLQKTCQNAFSKSFRVVLDHFENQPLCKGYSPCKILTLGQKLKFKKTCQNPFCN